MRPRGECPLSGVEASAKKTDARIGLIIRHMGEGYGESSWVRTSDLLIKSYSWRCSGMSRKTP